MSRETEIKKFLNGEWADLQMMALDYKSEEDRMSRLDELNSVNYGGVFSDHYFDLQKMELTPVKTDHVVECSCWEIRKRNANL